jgi:microcystin-dependent protein
MAAATFEMFLACLDSACMIGAIFPYATQDAPPNCLPCNGSLQQRADYPRLYAAIDPAYIVDTDSFRTPDLRGRVVLCAGGGYPRNSTGGAATVALTAVQNGPHTHTTQPHSHIAQPLRTAK